MSSILHSGFLAAAALVPMIAPLEPSSALAQEIESSATAVTAPAPGAGDVEFLLRTGGTFEFETDLDDGGDVEVWSARVGLDASWRINDQLRMSITTGYEHIDFDFSGSQGFAGLDPWDNVESFAIGAVLSVRLDETWGLSGGPLLAMSWENGADVSDSIQGGGLVAVSYRASDRLTIGGGFGVISQIEDDARFFPIIIIDWKITDTLSLTSRRETGGGPFSGTELLWQCSDRWELAFGANYRSERRFRLDDSGIAPDGVGRTRAWPLWLRVGYSPTPSIELNAFLGTALSGEVRLEDDNGDRIAEDDLDPVPVVGISGSIRF